MAMRTGERKDGSNYRYPISPTNQGYNPMELGVTNIRADPNVYGSLLENRIKELENNRDILNGINRKLQSSIDSLDIDENSQEIISLQQNRNAIEYKLKEINGTILDIRNELKRMINESQVPVQEGVEY